MSTDERKCKESTYSRTSTGRLIFRLPYKPSISILGSNRKTALTRFLQVERRLLKNHDLYWQYIDFLTEYQQLGHMVSAKPLSSDDNGNFHFPHHAVIKESSTTTKLRVVFDGSCKSSTGISGYYGIYGGVHGWHSYNVSAGAGTQRRSGLSKNFMTRTWHSST